MVCHPARRGVHAARAIQYLEWSGALGERVSRRARLGGLRHCSGRRPEVERHVRFDDRTTRTFGTGIPSTWL